MADQIRVGIIGASVDGSWATLAHLPALAQLAELAVTAVMTTREDSARRTAAAYDIPHWFTDVDELAAHPEVDLVVVSVKAPAHAAAIRPVLAAGKHVLSEWPLGANPAEAAELASAADLAGVVHAVSLQGYHSPGAQFVRDLLAEGRLGPVESVSVIAAGDPLGGGRTLPGLAYAADPAAGNTVLSIQVGHILAALDHIVGQLTDVSAVVANFHDQVVVAGTEQRIPNHTPGQVAVHGTLDGGALLSLSIHGGSASTPDGFLVRVAGGDGTLTITPNDPGHYLGWADWCIRLRSGDNPPTELPIPDRYRLTAPLPPGPPAHIAILYRELAQAITANRPAHPDFATALRHHRTLAAIETAAQTGIRQAVAA
jgi:predicted dehydrogenase